MGYIEEAVVHLKRAYELDPLFPQAADVYCAVLHASGRISEAIDLCKSSQAKWPEHTVFFIDLINSAAFGGDWPAFAALTAAARAKGVEDPALRASIRLGEAMRDDPQRLRAGVLENLRRQLAETGAAPLPLLLTASSLGLNEAVYAAIETASYDLVFDEAGAEPGGVYNPGIIFDPHYSRALMADPRFVGLCAKLGLCDYWVATDRWPDCAAALSEIYDFKAEVRRLAGTGNAVSRAAS